ncbi:MAG: hypothetical protein R3F62_15775 [Planctomycetota bacterium]
MTSFDAELSAYLEGLLDAEAETALEARLAQDPALRQAKDELERILAEPVALEPVEVPAELRSWVEAAAAPALEADASLEPVDVPAGLGAWVAERARASGAARDPLAEPVELEPVAVPAPLEAWVREQAAPPRGLLLAFPRAGWLVAAALLLVCLGLGAWSLDGRARAWSAELALQDEGEARTRAEDRAQLAELRALSLRARLDAAEDSLRSQGDRAEEAQREFEERTRRLEDERDRVASELADAREALAAADDRRARDAELLAQREAEVVEAQEALLAVLEGQYDPARLEGLEAERDAALADAAGARAEVARLNRALAARPGQGPPLEVASVQAVRRWDPARGWLPVQVGDALRPGEVVSGEGLQGRIELAGRPQRLTPELYVITEAGARPLPQAEEPDRAPLPRGSFRGSEPGAPRSPGLLGIVAPR